MEYHAPTNRFTIEAEDLNRMAIHLRYAIRKIRNGAGLDSKGYDYLNRKTDWAEHAEGAILEAAKRIGLDLGTDRPGVLDVSAAG